MTLPLMRGRADGRSGWRRAGLALLVVLAAGGGPARADDSDPFSATVSVDAAADTAAKARDMARADGQRRALAAIAEKLAGGAAAKLPKLDDKAITDLVASFEVANERMSAVHYVADYTFHFRPAETRRLFANAGITATDQAGKPSAAAADQSGKPLVVLPVYRSGAQTRLWDDPNRWRQAWDERKPAAGASRIVVPLGDAGDMAAIDSDKAQGGDAAALAAIASRNGSDDALVALAALRGSPDKPAGLDVTVRHYRAGKLVASHPSPPLGANPGEGERDLLRRAAEATAAAAESGWKNEPVPRYDQQGSLTAVLPITSLEDWVRVRDRLSGVSAIRKVALMALSRQEATIEIGYVGSIEQLKTALAGASLQLVQGQPLWRLARTGPDQAQ